MVLVDTGLEWVDLIIVCYGWRVAVPALPNEVTDSTCNGGNDWYTNTDTDADTDVTILFRGGVVISLRVRARVRGKRDATTAAALRG